MKTKKIQRLILLTAFLAILLATVSIFAVNKIIAKEKSNSDSRSNSSSINSSQSNSSKEKESEKIEKELKPEVKIEVREVEKEEEKTAKKETMRNEEKEEEKTAKKETTRNEEKKEDEIRKIDSKDEKNNQDSNQDGNQNKNQNSVSEIRSEVDGAEEVEYRLVKKGSVEPTIHLGKGKKVEEDKNVDEKDKNENEWSLEYDFSNVPVGEYDLYAEVRNQYGTYASEKTSMKIEKEDRLDNIGSRVQLGQEGITIKVSNIKNNNAGQKIKEIKDQEKIIENDLSLTEEEKKIKLTELEENKRQIIEKFNFRNQLEEIYKKKGEKGLTEEDRKALSEAKEILKVDSDGDGLPDHEELRIGTDPFSADTDGDGYLDGDEVANGYDPLLTSTKEGVDKIVFDEPKNSGKENILYQIEEVDFVKDDTSDDAGVSFKGRALPNSFITLYIYSSPVVVTVKTDEDGNWSYVLNKELEDGNHEVYAAVTDNTGKITSKSKPLAFVKTAQAIEPISSNQNTIDSAKNLSPIEASKNRLFVFVVLISVFSLISAVTSVVLLVKHNKEKLNS